ncbi:MAG: nuclear transport factor 2 family protein [Gammaproteobacteria bacterium]|nr:nuclear transport factor 2 family protein [Gammaproteobacteria bacterium]
MILRAVAYAGCLALAALLLVTAHAEQIRKLDLTDDIHARILALTKSYYQAWSYTQDSTAFDRAGRFYSKNQDNVYWDPMPPLEGFRGWDEYQHVVETVWIPGGMVAAGILFASDGSFQAWRHANVVWTASNCLVHPQMQDGSTSTIPCRGSQVWERSTGDWLVVHEIFSAPVHIAGTLFRSPRKADERVRPDAEFTRLGREIAARWGDGQAADAASRLRPYYGPDDTLHLYMPWAPHDGYPDWASFVAGLRDYVALGVERVQISPNDDVEATRRGDIAWSHGTVHFEFTTTGGDVVAADGRQSRVWRRQNDGWLIVHEHLAIPLGH